MAEGSANISEQIARLEQELQERRAQLEEQSGVSHTEQPSTKELLHQVVGERLQSQSAPSAPLASQAPAPAVLDEDSQTRVDELVNVAFAATLDEAIQQAVATGNPAIIDAFHDRLVDELYDEMVTQKKIEPVE